jgi:FkbH-like protein
MYRQGQPSELLESMLAYWQEQLQDAPYHLDLPYDYSVVDVQDAQNGTCERFFTEEHSRFLRQLGKSHGATLFSGLLSALYILMSRWCGQTDIVLGTVVAGRSYSEVETVFGCFVNFLALRARMSDGATVDEFIHQVTANVAGALNHQECPFDLVVNRLNPGQRSSRSPLYNVSLRLQNMEIDDLEMGSAHVEDLSFNMEFAQLDLMFEVVERPSGLLMSVQYDRTLFDENTVELLLTGYQEILDQWMSDPGMLLKDFQLPVPLIEQTKKARSGKPQLIVNATFTADPLEETLLFLSRRLDYPMSIKFAPYNQPLQQLLDPVSIVSTNSNGYNLFLIRWDDWIGASESDLRRRFQEFIDALRVAAFRCPTHFIVQLCPLAPSTKEEWEAVCLQLETDLIRAVEDLSHVNVLSVQQLEHYYPVEDYYNAFSDQQGHVPYTPEAYTALATLAFRKLHALSRPNYKVIVLDCDNTLWHGVCGELGPVGVEVSEAYRYLQARMLEQRKQGRLLCLCSKNSDTDVKAVFESNPDMLLSLDDVVAVRINWLSKSENVISLAEELNLGLDAFIFIDDDPVQCAEVRSRCPQVVTLQLPQESQSIVNFFEHLWVLDQNKAAAQDVDRTTFYKEDRKRQYAQAQSISLNQFLESLRLDIQIFPLTEQLYARAAELTQRTNQFNCTARRYEQAELAQQLQDQRLEGLVVKVSDRYGDYGIVGLMLFHVRQQLLNVDTFLLSCRAMGRGIEHTMVSHLGEMARERGIRAIRLEFRPTAKNEPAQQFLKSLGLTPEDESLDLSADHASTVTYIPEEHVEEAIPQRYQSAKSQPPSVKQTSVNHFEFIATTLTCPRSILDQVEQENRAVNDNARYAEPRNSIEIDLCQLWAKIVRLDRVGITDDFFNIGGDSLSATRLVAEIYSRWGVQVAIKAVFEYPRLEDFAAIIGQKIQSSPTEESEGIRARHDNLREDAQGSGVEIFEL